MPGAVLDAWGTPVNRKVRQPPSQPSLAVGKTASRNQATQDIASQAQGATHRGEGEVWLGRGEGAPGRGQTPPVAEFVRSVRPGSAALSAVGSQGRQAGGEQVPQRPRREMAVAWTRVVAVEWEEVVGFWVCFESLPRQIGCGV